jgi:hypothetical protein
VFGVQGNEGFDDLPNSTFFRREPVWEELSAQQAGNDVLAAEH